MRSRRFLVTVSAFVLWLSASPGVAFAAGLYRKVDLGTLGGPSSTAAGDIVGTGDGPKQLVRWHNAVPTVLLQTDRANAQSVEEVSVNASGDVVAYWYHGHLPYVFLWRDGVANPDVLDGTATAVNDNHDFLGTARLPSSHPYLNHGGNSTVDLTEQGVDAKSSPVDLNNAGQIAANLNLSGYTTHAVVYLPD